MGRQKIKGGTAVFICTVPPTFKPQRCWDIPDEILTAYLHAKNLAMPVALGFARVHNMTQVQALVQVQRPIETWAVVSRHLKPEWKKPNRHTTTRILRKICEALHLDIQQIGFPIDASELATEQEGGAV